jgi:hypothetical protein
VRVENVKVVPFNTPPTDPALGGSFRVAGYAPGYPDTILVSSLGNKYTFDANPDQLLNVNGVLHQSGSFRILPRSDSDIELVGVLDAGSDPTPLALSLSVAPNPARSARITFALPQKSEVDLRVFDLRGRQVAEIAKGSFPAGTHSQGWDGTGSKGERFAAGVYFYRLQVGNRVLTARGVLMQ